MWCKTWTHRQMGEVHHGHSAVHVSSVASFGRVVIFIPFVLTAVGNLSALRRCGESVWPTRSPIWIENPVSALTGVPVRSSCNWEWVSCPWFILLSQYDWASLVSLKNGAKIEHFTLQGWNPSTACMHFLRVFHAARLRFVLYVVLNETEAPEFLGLYFEVRINYCVVFKRLRLSTLSPLFPNEEGKNSRLEKQSFKRLSHLFQTARHCHIVGKQYIHGTILCLSRFIFSCRSTHISWENEFLWKPRPHMKDAK